MTNGPPHTANPSGEGQRPALFLLARRLLVLWLLWSCISLAYFAWQLVRCSLAHSQAMASSASATSGRYRIGLNATLLDELEGGARLIGCDVCLALCPAQAEWNADPFWMQIEFGDEGGDVVKTETILWDVPHFIPCADGAFMSIALPQPANATRVRLRLAGASTSWCEIGAQSGIP